MYSYKYLIFCKRFITLFSHQMLSEEDKTHIVNWKYNVIDKSLTTKIFYPLWKSAVELVPSYVAPNILSLSGLICILYAAYIHYFHFETYPRIVRICCVILIQLYQILDAIDGMHARKTDNASPLGELFDHACDNVGVVFLTYIVGKSIGIENVHTLYYLIQGSQICFLYSHIYAFINRVVYFPMLAGPGEFIMLAQLAILFEFSTNLTTVIEASIPIIYVIVLLVILYQIWFKIEHKRRVNQNKTIEYFGTKLGLSFCLATRCVSTLMVYLGVFRDIDVWDCICHGLILSVVCSDMIVAKMAQRNLHPWVVVACMLAMFHQNGIILFVVICYYSVMFQSLSNALGIRIFSPNCNVYVCGVYDLTHEAHMISFTNALKYGDRLVVGVHTDEAVYSYKKRYPNLGMEQRMRTVQQCKGVWKVIGEAPLKTTRKFMVDNRIDIVVVSEEYKNELDVWFDEDVIPFIKFTPRTEGTSTSDIVKAVRENNSDKRI